MELLGQALLSRLQIAWRRSSMDGLIFLRGAFIDSSIKKIALYAENANKVVNVVTINNMDDVNKYMKDNKISKMLVHKIECDNGAVRVYCYMK